MNKAKLIYSLLVHERGRRQQEHYKASMDAARAAAARQAHVDYQKEHGMLNSMTGNQLEREAERARDKQEQTKLARDELQQAMDWYCETFMEDNLE